MPESKESKDALNSAIHGRIPNSVGSNLNSKNHAQYIKEILTKLQGYEPSDEDIAEEMGPSAGSSIGGASGSFPQSLAPLQTLQTFNPGNKMIEALLQIATTRRREAGA